MSSNTPPTPNAEPGEANAAASARQLQDMFPALFGGAPKPVKLRIQADIQERAPGVFTKQVLSAFLRRHTGSTAYLVALTRATHRFDLDGAPSAELSEEHRQAAVEELARRRALRAERDAQGEQARRQRAALWHDFQTTTLTRANFCALKGIAPELLDAVLAQAQREAEERARQMQRPGNDRRPPRDGPPRGAPSRGGPPRGSPPRSDR